MQEALSVLESYTKDVDTAEVRAMDEARADHMNVEELAKVVYDVWMRTTQGGGHIDGQQHPVAGRYQNVASVASPLQPAHLREGAQDAKVGHSPEAGGGTQHVDLMCRRIGGLLEPDGQGTQSPVADHMEDGGIDGVCPPEVQDMVYQNTDEVGEDYDNLKQRNMMWASKEFANEGAPMDVGSVMRSYHHEDEEEDCEIAAVGLRA